MIRKTLGVAVLGTALLGAPAMTASAQAGTAPGVSATAQDCRWNYDCDRDWWKGHRDHHKNWYHHWWKHRLKLSPGEDTGLESMSQDS